MGLQRVRHDWVTKQNSPETVGSRVSYLKFCPRSSSVCVSSFLLLRGPPSHSTVRELLTEPPASTRCSQSGTWNCWQFSSVQLLSHVQLFATPWTAARQASLSITNSRSLPKLLSIESVMPSNHLILCRPQAATKPNQKNAGGVKRKEPPRHPFNLPERLALATILTERCTCHQEGLPGGIKPEYEQDDGPETRQKANPSTIKPEAVTWEAEQFSWFPYPEALLSRALSQKVFCLVSMWVLTTAHSWALEGGLPNPKHH